MRLLDLNLVTEAVKNMLIDACENIPVNVIERLKEAKEKEASPLGKSILDQIIENDLLAARRNVPICQDTGMVVCFLEIGSQVVFEGDIYEAVNQGVRNAYIDGFLRKSVVRHPLDRVNTKDNTPAVIHTKIVPGETVKITVAPKGAGSENMSLVKMLIPADGIEGIKKLVLDTVFNAGGKPCPPIIVGIGLGGNLEKAAMLAKEAVLREIDDEATDPLARKLEQELLQEINDLGVGPMGLGGTVTALAVKVNTYPCHIASLPVAINIQCHASRHKSVVL
ncbi:MAG TPA: fumarate hydratase [Bacilli bacterium]|jgi:fumarate hydratase subunit alpha|nr:fumarate hydratase [Acholeplasmataceae bacterium]OQB66164.1 MAG: L(+)-tartrate dehydratase subunit alpha [Tenericutes bacterium ADurb.Bin140]HOE77130.1 fumarate hydratase [Bacilli bacterium]HON63711.1 fumarate hydratase [Bacilli bacterium]HOR95412.1 fumarate hydratase [Bacilli bacterium]